MLRGFVRRFVQFDRYMPELSCWCIAFALEEAFSLLVDSTHNTIQGDAGAGTCITGILARAFLRQAEQERTDTATTVLRVDTDECIDLFIVPMPHTRKSDKLSLIRDYDPGIGRQVELRLLPVRGQILHRTTHQTILRDVTCCN